MALRLPCDMYTIEEGSITGLVSTIYYQLFASLFFSVDNRKCLIHGSTQSLSYLCNLSYSIDFATGFPIYMLTHRGFSAWMVSNGVLAEHLVAVDERSHRVSC